MNKILHIFNHKGYIFGHYSPLFISNSETFVDLAKYLFKSVVLLDYISVDQKVLSWNSNVSNIFLYILSFENFRKFPYFPKKS